MRKFTDECGTEWTLFYNLPVIRRLAKADLNVVEFVSSPCDFETFGRVLHCFLEPQIDALGLTQDQFAERLGGQSLVQSWNALQDEVLDFLSHTNPPLATMLRKQREAAGALLSKANAAVEQVNFSDDALNSPEPSVLTLSESA